MVKCESFNHIFFGTTDFGIQPQGWIHTTLKAFRPLQHLPSDLVLNIISQYTK